MGRVKGCWFIEYIKLDTAECFRHKRLGDRPFTNSNLCFTIYTRSAKEDLFGGICDSVSGTGRYGSA